MSKKRKRVQKKKFHKPERQATGKNIRFDYSVLVTGYPRTGTSTAMRMLYLGGMDVICDRDKMIAHHQFDPYGNFEMNSPLYNLRQHQSTWTDGAAVKVVSPYVVTKPGLPMDRTWKVIFMLRPIGEIIASLAALNTIWEYEPVDAIRDCKKYLDMNDCDITYIDYRDMIDAPIGIAHRIKAFLDIDELDTLKMASAVSKTPREDYKGDKIIRPPREIINFGRL